MDTDPPNVSVFPALMVTKPPGSAMTISAQFVSAPRTVVLALVTVLSHCAVSPEPGAVPPTQLLPRIRLSVLLALEI